MQEFINYQCLRNYKNEMSATKLTTNLNRFDETANVRTNTPKHMNAITKPTIFFLLPLSASINKK